jgi:hypothetical protein
LCIDPEITFYENPFHLEACQLAGMLAR